MGGCLRPRTSVVVHKCKVGTNSGGAQQAVRGGCTGKAQVSTPVLAPCMSVCAMWLVVWSWLWG